MTLTHDPDTERHGRRVADLALQLAKENGIRGHALVNLWIAALLHDVGKVGVSDKVINTPGALDAAGWREIRRHPLFAYQILLPVAASARLMEIAMFHHEKFDGSGYPFGLKGDEIPMVVRIVTVADSFDAICSDRPYRRGRSQPEALRVMEVDKHFDPTVMLALRSLVERGLIYA
jgi:putative two-component system response regulator